MKPICSVEYETPANLFHTLHTEFAFTLDVCATPQNAKCPTYFTKHQDGLAQDWSNQVIWMNPPYTRQIGLWIRKAHDAATRNSTVVCLIQGRSTDTQMWHDYVMKADEIRWIKGRLTFSTPDNHHARCNHASVLVIFRPRHPTLFHPGPKTSSIDTTGKTILT